MKQLIVTADDVGLHAGMTEGAIRAHREGIVTACSLVANGVAFDDAVARLREVPTLEVGVHLALVEERALTTGQPMPKSYVSFLLSRRSVDVERELRAQIEKILATGLPVTHFNGHQHLHALPPIFELVVRLAEEYGVGYVRIPNDIVIHEGLFRSVAVMALNLVAGRAKAFLRPSIRTNDFTIGIAAAGHLTAIGLADLVTYVGEGVTELVTHPGVAVDAYPHWRYAWDEETAALCDSRIRWALAKAEIELIAPSKATAIIRRP